MANQKGKNAKTKRNITHAPVADKNISKEHERITEVASKAQKLSDPRSDIRTTDYWAAQEPRR